jgi:hypothetical protein
MMPQLGIAETRVVFHQGERAQVQAGAQRDAVHAGIQRRGQAHAQGVGRRVHGELFHAVDKHHAVAALGFHGAAHVQPRGLGDMAEVELHAGFVRVVDVVFVELRLVLDEAGVETAVDTSVTIASEMWPMPPRRAVSSASSAVEISTPMPPTMIGTSSCLPNFKRKSSTRFIVILTDWTSPARRAPAIHSRS